MDKKMEVHKWKLGLYSGLYVLLFIRLIPRNPDMILSIPDMVI